ncbi:Pyrophosphate--fructose 6-phosphate 1-phosphotransferase subunit beta 1 [Citrus sinensis]|uniref:Pyrophosphate--fructose 6-phosphate 1-phosphotransferase subunit beta 1 n=1 Tax=Citrus sinensis TaxID=2711 RepID=A0ACB8NKX7_CITSI|nr:Pyrophosphate--fructose 6-phosphate 1-phosphotransferase subunit beta 1 [Citrus sinensis]
MSPSLVANADLSPVTSGTVKGRVASVYSELQTSRIDHALPLPSVLKNPFKIVDGPASSAAGNPDEIAKLFPNLFGQPSALLVPNGADAVRSDEKLKIGVVLSGGQAPGGHNVISGIYDYLQDRAKGSVLYGFRGGPAGIMKCKYVELTSNYIYPYRNQFKQATETAVKLDLDGLVVIGGDDSNTNACLLAEHFRSKNLKTLVMGCPKTIDGDLKCKEVPASFGFDTACKMFVIIISVSRQRLPLWIYAEMIGNVMIDARSTGKYYHFVRLMGRAASHITLECALQTHPNITIIGEEVIPSYCALLFKSCMPLTNELNLVQTYQQDLVAAKKQTLKNVTDYIVDIICKRAELGYNYGVILIPEGLIDFIPEVQQLIAELNEILAHEVVDEGGQWKKKLTKQSLQLFEFLPQAIQEQLMLERDPHGNVQVAKIETEKMLIQMVETELENRKKGVNKGQFKGQSHFFGYEGRCGLPTNFDATYCYALGYGAGALLHSGKTGLISSVGNLAAPVEEWTVSGTALTALMDVERRHGKFKPVIKKAMVELDGAPFKKFVSMRDEWALNNRYISPGPIQFTGPTSGDVNNTLLLELGAQVGYNSSSVKFSLWLPHFLIFMALRISCTPSKLKIGFDRSSAASNLAWSPSHSWMVHFVRGWADLCALTRNDKSEVMATSICGKHCLEDVEITEAMAILEGTVMAKSAGLQPLIIES